MKIKTITENINNLDNAENKVAALNPVMSDAVAVSKKAQKEFEKETEPFDKPVLGTKDDKIKEARGLTEDYENDGWDLEDSDLVQVLQKLEDVKYEIDNCVRGSYATNGADTYTELADVVKDLANELIDCADAITELDEQLTEAGQFTFTNGTLDEFDPEDLVRKVKERKTALHTIRDFNNKQYTFAVSPRGAIETPDYIWIDVMEDTGEPNPQRIFMQKYTTYEDAIRSMNEVKDHIMDTVVDEKVEEALNEDGRKNREMLTPEQKKDEDEMNRSFWGIIYNELEKDTDGTKNRVNKKASQRYTYDNLSTDADGNITVYAPVKEKLQNAINVAEAYGLKFKVGLGSSRNKNHTFACTIYIPEGYTVEEGEKVLADLPDKE